jgi:hypothetical protein
VENTLPPNSSAVVAIFEERWVAEVEKALAKATKTEKHHVHDNSAESDPALRPAVTCPDARPGREGHPAAGPTPGPGDR